MKTNHLFFGRKLLWTTGVALLFLNACLEGTPNQEKSATENYRTGNKQVKVYLTAKNTNYRLSQIDTLTFSRWKQPDEMTPTIMVDPDKRFQEIVGIGGALTDASAETFYQMPEEAQDEILTAYFDREEGIGYSLCRTHINSCDFSSESYAYTEVEGDTALEHFSIEHDREYRIPFIKEALSASDEGFKIFASPWSPPAWMKTNGNMLQGGKLKAQYRDAWARYYIRFMEAYEQEGIPIWGLTVQNEPMAVQTWESCIYTAAEERDFVKNHLGHFSKFIRPGARRVIASSNNDDLLATAFINPDNSLAIVVLNMTGQSMDYKTWIDQQAFEATSPAHSIMTLVVE